MLQLKPRQDKVLIKRIPWTPSQIEPNYPDSAPILGEIVDVGDEVEGFKVGDRVLTDKYSNQLRLGGEDYVLADAHEILAEVGRTGLARRKIMSHSINPANEKIDILVNDLPHQKSNANHRYSVLLNGVETIAINFQDGPVQADGNGVNGLTHEVLLAIVADRLRGFQEGPYACQENADALVHISHAIDRLHDRTKARMARGVEGTHTV